MGVLSPVSAQFGHGFGLAVGRPVFVGVEQDRLVRVAQKKVAHLQVGDGMELSSSHLLK